MIADTRQSTTTPLHVFIAGLIFFTGVLTSAENVHEKYCLRYTFLTNTYTIGRRTDRPALSSVHPCHVTPPRSRKIILYENWERSIIKNTHRAPGKPFMNSR